MPTPRSKTELLQLVLDNIDRLESGLCLLIYRLYKEDKISKDEKEILDMIIYWNRPIGEFPGTYYYPTGNITVRKEYLTSLILKYSKEQ